MALEFFKELLLEVIDNPPSKLLQPEFRTCTAKNIPTIKLASPMQGMSYLQDIPCICVLKAIMLKWDT